MSVNVMAQAWGLKLETAEMLVLLAMADHADHNGYNVYPSTKLIAWKTGFSTRHVRRVIDSLVEIGILQVQEKRKGRTTIYRIDCSQGERKEPITTPDTVSPLTEDTPDKVSPLPLTPRQEGTDIAMSPEPSKEPSIEPKESAASDKPKTETEIDKKKSGTKKSTPQQYRATLAEPEQKRWDEIFYALAIGLHEVDIKDAGHLSQMIHQQVRIAIDYEWMNAEAVESFLTWYKDENSGANLPSSVKGFTTWIVKYAAQRSKAAPTVADEVDLEHEAAMDAWFESKAGAA